MFGPKLIETVHSDYSGNIRVMKGWGHTYLATGVLTQSGDIVREVWEPVLKKITQPNKSWLILGLAGGTLATLISQKYQPSKIIGVEIDPVMVALGRKYFALDKLPVLEVITTDAHSYISHLKSHFDYILVDMYFGDKLPEFVYNPRFLTKLKQNGKTVVFNHLFYTPDKKAAAESLVNQLQGIFPHLSLNRRLTNLLLVCAQ